MKLILSRKGFDSENGGIPSPILPDGKMISLPIPDTQGIPYYELTFPNLGTYNSIIESLTGSKKIKGNSTGNPDTALCHLDPDLRPEICHRPPGWKPLFGQCGAAAGHLINQKVAAGDIFLFFGTFQFTGYSAGKLQFKPDNPPFHALFGFLQIGDIYYTKDMNNIPEYMRDHPHALQYRDEVNNTLFAAADSLSLDTALPGAGTFNYSPNLRLTQSRQPNKSLWSLPECFRNCAVSYHIQPIYDPKKFQSARKGQEFVLECTPTIESWIRQLISSCSESRI